ncbi:MAG: SprB repeat-containing protein [bacterium]|nr:SprB repeat-containing protein [bacterium]
MKNRNFFILLAFIAIACKEDNYIPMEIEIEVINPFCAHENGGKIDITVTHGSPPYSYEWSNGFTSEDLEGIQAGTYSVKVYDGEGRVEIRQNIVVDQPGTLNVSTNSKHNFEIGGTDGYIYTVVTGGTPPYNFQWSNGQTTSVLEKVGKGIYGVVVTDSNNCQAQTSAIIMEPIDLLFDIITESPCEPSVEIQMTIQGGLEPYTILWSTGDNTQNISDVYGGVYDVTVRDELGSNTASSIEVAHPRKLEIELNANFCGSATFVAIGGTPPYNYFHMSQPLDTNYVEKMPNGYNLFTVEDSNGCTRSKEFDNYISGGCGG